MSSTTPHRVLLVDDDAAARKLYRTQLVASGYEVMEAASGIEAVETSEKGNFHAVLMDLNMPGLDGWMAMSLIKARRPALPIIILTAMTEGDLEARAKTAGAAGFLTKPCTSDTLARAVARAIRG